jgi:hypothetical protein
MSFGTFLDAAKDWIDTVHFPAIHAQYPPHAGFYPHYRQRSWKSSASTASK